MPDCFDSAISDDYTSCTELGLSSKKSILAGTHRVCSPEETLARVMPFLSHMGITRIADVTHLDDIGIPVFQAIRPNSRNLSVSQGKGVTEALAKVSAVMESIEGWHAEQPQLPVTQATIGDMAPLLPYSLYDLNIDKYHLMHDALELEWFPAHLLGKTGANKTFVPADYVRLDFTTCNEWLPPTFVVSSNGLASGNIPMEAILHGLYEIIERDTFEMVRRGELRRMPLDPMTIDGDVSAPLIAQLQRAGITARIASAIGPTGIACFEVSIISPWCPIVASGYGCHLDRDVALCRAITEAAQSRLTIIAGTRDDIRRTTYKQVHSKVPLPAQPKRHAEMAHFQDLPSCVTNDLTEDLQNVLRRINAIEGMVPLVVDLTRREYNIPVVFVIVPEFRLLEPFA